MRLNGRQIFPEGYEAMANLQKVVDNSGIDSKLLMLVVTRASQINGCAYCLDMHTKDAIAIGENPQRLYVLEAWRETPFYSEKERAALAWCESLTLISQTGAPDETYEKVEKLFSPKQIMALTFAIVAINGWNRLAISQRYDVGGYVSHLKSE